MTDEHVTTRRRPFQMSLGRWFVIIAVIAVVCGIVSLVRVTEDRQARAEKIRWIGTAIENRADAYGNYVSSVDSDSFNQQAHSWRILIVPFIEKQSFYDAYDTDKPWNSPENLWLTKPVPDSFIRNAYQLPAYRANDCTTDILMIVDAKQAGYEAIIVEVRDSGIHWMQPRDITLAEAVSLVRSNSGRIGCSYAIGEEGSVFRNQTKTRAWLTGLIE